MSHFSTRQIAVTGLLGALTAALGLMPVGGFIPVPTPAGNATTMHVPTIIAGIVEGPVVGGLVGLMFGVFSFWRAQTQANPVAKAMFSDPLVAFLPRILIGVVAAYMYRLSVSTSSRSLACAGLAVTGGYTTYSAVLHKAGLGLPGAAALGVLASVLIYAGAVRALRNGSTGPVLGALVGTAVNTIGVLGLSTLRGYIPGTVALGIGVLHGLPEMLVAAVLVALIYRGLSRIKIVRKPGGLG